MIRQTNKKIFKIKINRLLDKLPPANNLTRLSYRFGLFWLLLFGFCYI